jgi:carbon storage regulator
LAAEFWRSTGLLVFTRKAGEGLVIGGEVEIRILSVERDHVKVGIVAPRQISVHRHEVHEAIVKENLAASKSSAGDLGSLQQLIGNIRKR